MKRREFITLLGGAAGVAARGACAAAGAAGGRVSLLQDLQSLSARPLTAFRKGLGEAGYVEGRNVTIEYRWRAGGPSRVARAGCGFGSNAGRRAIHDGRGGTPVLAAKSGDVDDPNCLRTSVAIPSGPAWSRA